MPRAKGHKIVDATITLPPLRPSHHSTSPPLRLPARIESYRRFPWVRRVPAGQNARHHPPSTI